ncbi:hypothetical protein DsansV1_C04g0044731 [Dioscorea sansibarensis]
MLGSEGDKKSVHEWRWRWRSKDGGRGRESDKGEEDEKEGEEDGWEPQRRHPTRGMDWCHGRLTIHFTSLHFTSLHFTSSLTSNVTSWFCFLCLSKPAPPCRTRPHFVLCYDDYL